MFSPQVKEISTSRLTFKVSRWLPAQHSQNRRRDHRIRRITHVRDDSISSTGRTFGKIYLQHSPGYVSFRFASPEKRVWPTCGKYGDCEAGQA